MIYNNCEVIKIYWMNTMKGSMGMIKAKDVNTGEIKIFIGRANGFDETLDIRNILDYGHKLPIESMKRFLEE